MFLPAKTSQNHIPRGRPAVPDGQVVPGEWDDAASTEIPILPDWKVRVRFKHDDQNLYFLFERVKHGKERLYPEILLDPHNLRGERWEKGQWWLHVSYNLCEGNGEPNVYNRNGVFQCAHQKEGWEANNPPNAETEAIEVRVSFSKLGIQSSSGLRLGLALAVTDATGDRSQKWFFWPPTADLRSPRSWEKVCLD